MPKKKATPATKPSTADGETDPVKAGIGAGLTTDTDNAGATEPAADEAEPQTVEEQIAALRSDLTLLNRTVKDQAEQIAALRGQQDETKGHVHRMGSQPGIKLF